MRRELPGFLVNRVQVAIQREVWDLVDRGVATREEIDAAIRGTVGFRFAVMGPLEIHDFAGLDIQLATYRNLVGEIRSDTIAATSWTGSWPRAIWESRAAGVSTTIPPSGSSPDVPVGTRCC